jgi:protein TonB
MPVDLDLRLVSDAARLGPDVWLNLGDGGGPACDILPLTVRPVDVRVLSHVAVRPDWAWPGAMAAAVTLHAGVGLLLLIAAWTPPPFSPLPEAIDVAIVSETEAAPGLDAGIGAASTYVSKLSDASREPAAVPVPLVDETHPQAAAPADPLEEAMPARPLVEETPPTLPHPAEPNAAASLPERPAAAEDVAVNASAAQVPLTPDPPHPPSDSVNPPEPPTRALTATSLAPQPLVPPSAERDQRQEPIVTASAMPEPVAADLSAAAASPEPPPTQVVPQSPGPDAKPVEPPTHRAHEITNPASAKPARPVVAKSQKPTEKAPKSEVNQNKTASTAPVPTRSNAGLGAGGGSSESLQAARASYGAILSAEIARHKVYPDAARAVGATGAVGVLLTVGPTGRIVSHSITRSSGNAAIDHEVDAMMDAVQAPSPPGGVFHSGVTIRFSLR